MKKNKFFFSLLVFFCGLNFQNIFSQSMQIQSDEKYSKLNELLAGYLKNDLQLKKYTLLAQSKLLDYDSSKISNGISVSLSTGEMRIQSSSDKTRITVTPQASVGIPSLNDASANFSLPVTIKDGEKSVSNGSVSVSAGIITGKNRQREVSLKESSRAVLEAERNVKERALSAEKEFYENLKKLYNYATGVLQAKSDLYDDSADLRLLVVQGYSKTSAQYRQANLKVESDKRTVLEKQRLFERETMIFTKKCGIEYVRVREDDRKDPVKSGEISYESALSYLPDEIPSVDGVKIRDFEKSNYSSIEKAEWNKEINQAKREADYKMTLYATGEYKFNDNFSNCDSVGAKLTWKWNGLSASAGTYMPTGNSVFGSEEKEVNDNPYFSFSLAFDPNAWRISKIDLEQEKIDSQLDEIELESANESYDRTVLEKISSYNDIAWNRKSYAEQLDMYTKLEVDMSKWLKMGIVTENDYLDAKNNKEKSRINVLLNSIDVLIYNDETKLLFHE